MRAVVIVIFCVGLVACTPKQPSPPPPPNLVPTVDAPPAKVTVDAAAPVVEIDAAPVTDEPPPPPPADVPSISVPDPVPAVKGAVTKITTGATVTITGIKIKFTHSSHKSGGELGMWGFEVERFGAKQEFELRNEDSKFEAEVDAKGTLLVFRHVDYNNFEIVVAAPKTPKQLDTDACRAEIEKAAAGRKLVVGDSGTSSENGFVKMSTKGWVGHCGQYTRRVWFTPARERRRRR